MPMHIWSMESFTKVKDNSIKIGYSLKEQFAETIGYSYGQIKIKIIFRYKNNNMVNRHKH